MTDYQCAQCHRPLSRPNASHYCAEVDMDELFEGKSPELVLIFDRLLEQLIQWNGVRVSASRRCIVFLHKRTFLLLRPMKNQLDVRIFLPEHSLDHPILKCREEGKRYNAQIRLKHLDDLTAEVFKLLKRSYQFN